MEIQIKEQNGFRPVTITLTINTPEELVLLYHVLNHNRLRDILFDGSYGPSYNKDYCADTFSTSYEDYDIIPAILNKNGYTL